MKIHYGYEKLINQTLESYELRWPSSLKPNHARQEAGVRGRRPLMGWVPLGMLNTINSSICISNIRTVTSRQQIQSTCQSYMMQAYPSVYRKASLERKKKSIYLLHF